MAMKYQEALNNLRDVYYPEFDSIAKNNFDEDIKILQELIDNYSKLEAERNHLVMDNASLIDKNNQLEKALDMACLFLTGKRESEEQ